ncbi:7159_t:CDS:2 [Diversispora eburnea]|uniref:7159_t:CDS:1 n=1 Tax=Diversispora eburnea TaxID=1213867 RepID=A0A9N9AUA0_9GLOM|nr:7159_t:CDS:2 [Diversispora eburnea]
MEKHPLEYFKETEPRKYQFYDCYQYRRGQKDFAFNFRLEATSAWNIWRNMIPLWSTSLTISYGLSCRGRPSRGDITHTTTMSACVPLTLCRSLDPVVVKVTRVMVQGTELLKRKFDAAKENLEINGSSDNNSNIKSTELEELEPNDEINIDDNVILDFDPLSDLSDLESYISANERLIRRILKPEDDNPLGMKVDGIFHTLGEKGVEIGMVEFSGGYLNSDMPRYIKDHVKGQEVQVWGMDILVSKIYRMFLIGLDDYFKLFEEFKKSPTKYSRSSLLKNYIGDIINNSTLNPTGKKPE